MQRRAEVHYAMHAHVFALQITDIDEVDADQYVLIDSAGAGRPCGPPKGAFGGTVRLQGCVVVRQGRWNSDTFWTVFPDEAARLCKQLRFYKERNIVLETRAREAAEAAEAAEAEAWQE